MGGAAWEAAADGDSVKVSGERILVHPEVFEQMRARLSPSMTIRQQLLVFGSCILELPGQRFSAASIEGDLLPVAIQVDAKDVPAAVWAMLWAANQWKPA